MEAESEVVFPTIAPIERDNIPELLRSIPRWINWRAGPIKPSGKFDKIPTHPFTSRNIDPQDPRNWLTHEDALAAYERKIGNGVGFVMSDEHPIFMNEQKYYLVALDFDKCTESISELKEIGLRLGRPYVELSPSGNGLRMFALSRTWLKSGNDGKGHELYCTKQFLTVTGWQGRGEIKDATAALIQLHQQWFGVSAKIKESQHGANTEKFEQFKLEPNTGPLPPPETDREIQRVKHALSFVSSDCPYSMWRDIIWAILWTGWRGAEQIALEWSMQAKHRFDESAFDNLVKSFDPTGGITLGTVYHYAKQNGWKNSEANSGELSPDADGSSTQGGSAQLTRLLTAAQVKALPILPYRVRGLLPAQGVAALYGEPGSGKSFVALDLGFGIAAGHADWFGMTVKPAPVVYIALEGRGGVAKRVKAWEKHYNVSAPDRARFWVADFVLLDLNAVTQLAADILASLGPGAVVIIDTLNQSAPGADENASDSMGKIIKSAKQLAAAVEGLVILIHHSGKDPSRGMRGHSSLIAAMDAAIEVTNSKPGRTWKTTKQRDDGDGLVYDFELVPYVVDVDQDGLDVTSCAIRRCTHPPVTKTKRLSGKNQKAAMTVLGPLLTGNPAGLSYQAAIQPVAAVLTCSQSRRSTIAKETIDGLIRNGHLLFNAGVITLP